MHVMKPFGAHGCNVVRICFAAAIFGLLPLDVAALPDLIVAAHRARVSAEYQRRSFSTADCAYQEGCVHAFGTRKLLLLDAAVINKGATDLVIGDPRKRPDLFVWSGCHGHYHLRGLATYRVLTLGGRQVAKTYKQGFCLRDDSPKKADAGRGKYTCDYQGITVGWQDVYDKSLDCQWVDITGVKPGKYNLEIVVNPRRIFKESNFQNNRVLVRINVPKI